LAFSVGSSMDALSIAMNGRQPWVPLDEILSAYVQMYRQNRIVAIAAQPDNDSDDEDEDVDEHIEYPDPTAYESEDSFAWHKPWIVTKTAEVYVESAIEAYKDLIKAINERMPDQSIVPAVEENTLLLPADLEKLRIASPFLDPFLTKSPRSQFKYIAPGLRVQSFEELQNQPLAELVSSYEEDPDYWSKYPFLLFAAHAEVTSETAKASEASKPFSWWRAAAQRDSISAGFYLCDPGSVVSRDSCALVLPYAIGKNGHARTGDEAFFDENHDRTKRDIPKPGNSFDSLYQPGYNHIDPGALVQVERVFKRWLFMIQEGHWEVGPEGVKGGIEKWREADTEDNWKYYQIVRWF
jgi:hypothetical protein